MVGARAARAAGRVQQNKSKCRSNSNGVRGQRMSTVVGTTTDVVTSPTDEGYVSTQ